MRKILGIIGGFALGFVTGYVAGNANMFRTFSKEIEKLTPRKEDREVLEVMEVEHKKKEDTRGEEQKSTPNKFEKPELDKLVKKYRVEEEKYTDYSQNLKTDEPDPPEDYLGPEDDEEEEDDDEDSPEPEFSKPQIMSLFEFENEKKNYEVATLTYYIWDDTLCDSQENVITSPEDLIGDDALLCFGLGSQDPNTVYVCNDKRGIKYEVVKVDNSYQETVLGIKNDGLSVNKKRREDIEELD